MSKKATYLGALMDAGIRALGIAGGGLAGYNLMPGSGLTKAAGAALGGSIGGNVASSLLQRMDRNQYIGVGRKGVKPVKVKKHIIINEEDNMSRSLTESLINEGIRALREQSVIKNMTRSAASARVRGGAMDDFNMSKPPSSGYGNEFGIGGAGARTGAIDDFNMNKPAQYGNEFGPGPAKRQSRAMDMPRGGLKGLRGPSRPGGYGTSRPPRGALRNPQRPSRSGGSEQGRLV